MIDEVADEGRKKMRLKSGISAPLKIDNKHTFQKPTQKIILEVNIPSEITVAQLASSLNIKAGLVVKELMKLGLSVSVNESIDANQKRMDEHFDFLIQTYNHLHKRDENRPKEFIAALKEGKEFKSELEDFTEYWGKYSKYANKWKKQKADFSNIYGGEAWETFEGKGDFDPDVRAELVAKDENE